MADNNKSWKEASSLDDIVKLSRGAKEAEKMIRTVTRTRKRDKFKDGMIIVSSFTATVCGGIMIYEYAKGKASGCNGTAGEVNSAF